MAKQSAGLVLYRTTGNAPEFLLVHPGGPFFRGKDAGTWSIPKGEIEEGESPLESAIREFGEETSFSSAGPFLFLGSITQKSGKTVTAWACRGDCDPETLRSNACTIEWPPKSGKQLSFPEVDRAAFFTLEAAREKINPAQVALLERLTVLLAE
jgi:predicted NUDIX family NTP pyrophosphohydrolase